MHEAEFARAVLPPVRRVFGLRMLPYSIGHELYLIREGNACLGGEIPDRRAVAEAALICCSTWNNLQKPSPLIRFYIALWRLRTRKLNAITEFLKFRAYRDEALFVPQTYPADLPKGVQVRMTGTPFLLQLIRFVSIGLGVSNPYDYPLGLARWHWLAKEESEGNICVQSEYDAHKDRLAKGEFTCPA